MWQKNGIFILFLCSRTTVHEVHSSSPKHNAHGRSFSGRADSQGSLRGFQKASLQQTEHTLKKNIRGTQREYSSKPLKHRIVKRILVFKVHMNRKLFLFS